jgi:hypothetical protein
VLRDRVDRIPMSLAKNIGAKLWNPAVKQRAALFAEPLIYDLGEVA